MKTILTLAASLILGSVTFSQGGMQGMHHKKPSPPQHGMRMGGGMGMGSMMESCMRDMKAGHDKVSALAAKMNASQGADRIDATTAVINQMLANENKMMAMCHMMMSTHGGMGGMHGMGGGMHGGMGMNPGKPAPPKSPEKGHAGHHGG